MKTWDSDPAADMGGLVSLGEWMKPRPVACSI